jgi:hypothetical protein
MKFSADNTRGNDPRSSWPQLLRGPLIGSPCFEKPLPSYLGRAISSGQYCSRGLWGFGKKAPAHCDRSEGEGQARSTTAEFRRPDNASRKIQFRRLAWLSPRTARLKWGRQRWLPVFREGSAVAVENLPPSHHRQCERLYTDTGCALRIELFQYECAWKHAACADGALNDFGMV